MFFPSLGSPNVTLLIFMRWCHCVLLQDLDCDFTDDNRRKCAESAKPLMEAVEELTTYASSPEFASVPAKISVEVCMGKRSLVSHVNIFFNQQFFWDMVSFL